MSRSAYLFVSFTFTEDGLFSRQGIGSAEVHHPEPIKSHTQLLEIQELLQSKMDYRVVTITNWRRFEQ